MQPTSGDDPWVQRLCSLKHFLRKRRAKSHNIRELAQRTEAVNLALWISEKDSERDQCMEATPLPVFSSALEKLRTASILSMRVHHRHHRLQ